jgi:hypothetical protein
VGLVHAQETMLYQTVVDHARARDRRLSIVLTP